MNSVFKRKLDNTLKVEPFKNQDSDEPSDEALVGRFLNDSRISYELLVLRYKQRIFEFIYFQIKQYNHDAEDLTQEVFIELYKKRPIFAMNLNFQHIYFLLQRTLYLIIFELVLDVFLF